jgi:hypothetical protein
MRCRNPKNTSMTGKQRSKLKLNFLPKLDGNVREKR